MYAQDIRQVKVRCIYCKELFILQVERGEDVPIPYKCVNCDKKKVV